MGVDVRCVKCGIESYEHDYSIDELIDIGDIELHKIEKSFDNEGNLLYTCEDCF